MKGTIVIDMDAIGSTVDELSYEIDTVIDPDEKKRRVAYLVDALKSIDGGAKEQGFLMI